MPRTTGGRLRRRPKHLSRTAALVVGPLAFATLLPVGAGVATGAVPSGWLRATASAAAPSGLRDMFDRHRRRPPRPRPPVVTPTPRPTAPGTPSAPPPRPTPSPTTGSATGSPTATGGATSGPAPTATSPTGPAPSVTSPATGQGPAYDPRLVPAGDPGSTAFRITRTGELPTASGDGTGNFRTVCAYSHMNTDDPIVAPMRLGASHLHVFWGNTRTDASSTAASIATTGGSTCRGGTANRTAYWAPALVDTTSGAPLAPDLVHVYYKSGYYGLAPGDIGALPAGLRMIAGSSTARGPQEHAGWRCWNAGGAVTASVPRCAAGDFVTMTLDFPQCWNGRDLDSADHKSHMSYPVGGRCPASHPVAVPVVTYNVLYPVRAGADTSRWRLSSDTYPGTLPGGYSVHGDWFDGWDPAVKQTWTDGCVRRPVTCGSHMLGDGRVMEGDV